MTFDLTIYDPQTGSIVDGRCVICREDATYHDSLHLRDDGKEPPIEDFWYCEKHALQMQARINSKLGVQPDWPRQLQSARRWQARVEPFYPYPATQGEIAEVRARRAAYLERRAHGPLSEDTFNAEVAAAIAETPKTYDAALLATEETAELLKSQVASDAVPHRRILHVVEEE